MANQGIRFLKNTSASKFLKENTEHANSNINIQQQMRIANTQQMPNGKRNTVYMLCNKNRRNWFFVQIINTQSSTDVATRYEIANPSVKFVRITFPTSRKLNFLQRLSKIGNIRNCIYIRNSIMRKRWTLDMPLIQTQRTHGETQPADCHKSK